MVVGVAVIELYIHDSRSLKDKRGVLRTILKKTQNEFNVSIAEIGGNDDWKRSKIGLCMVGNDKAYINSKMDKILNFIDQLYLAEVMRSTLELTSYSDLVEGERTVSLDEQKT